MSAPAIVLLHGFTHTGASWDPVIAALGERYRAIAPDLRGHGTAAEAEPVTLEAVIEDVAASAPDRFGLVGYSMGGRIALQAALALGERVTRLVLIGASPGIPQPSERSKRVSDDELLANEIERAPGIEAVAERWARTPVLAGQPARVMERVHADRLRNTPGGLARALRGLGTGALEPLWDRLEELSMPVALVVGERDAKFRSIASEMASEIPEANVIVVPNAGHAVHLESPWALADVIAGGRLGDHPH